jgi:predicted protein tyrosine phosphatase
MSRNRLALTKNPYQGDFKKVLTVCSGGLLRSPTAAFVLSQAPYNFNTRACGVTVEYALIPIDHVLVEWADEVVFVHPSVEKEYVDRWGVIDNANVIVLNIPDVFSYRDERLIAAITLQYDAAQHKLQEVVNAD